MKKTAPVYTERSQSGFTLIELVVVITITAVIGVYALANYNRFGGDQNLNNAVLDAVSLLRQAQTNASTNVICSNGTWQVIFATTKTLNLQCSTSASPLKVLQLDKDDPNISISAVSGSSCPTMPPFTAFTISFTSLNGNANVGSFASCTSLRITLNNSQTTSTKDLLIEQGGRIYAP